MISRSPSPFCWAPGRALYYAKKQDPAYAANLSIVLEFPSGLIKSNRCCSHVFSKLFILGRRGRQKYQLRYLEKGVLKITRTATTKPDLIDRSWFFSSTRLRSIGCSIPDNPTEYVDCALFPLRPN